MQRQSMRDGNPNVTLYKAIQQQKSIWCGLVFLQHHDVFVEVVEV
jgi:hypothetical protein